MRMLSAIVAALSEAAGFVMGLVRPVRLPTLTPEDLERIDRGNTPLHEWPEVDLSAFAPGTFPEDIGPQNSKP